MRSRTIRAEAREPVHRITTAPVALTEDVRARQRRYLISMGIRTVCFLLAIVTSGPLRWAFAVGALLLPYFSVIIANSGRGAVRPSQAQMVDRVRPALEPSPPPVVGTSADGSAAKRRAPVRTSSPRRGHPDGSSEGSAA